MDDLIERLRDVDRNPPNLHERQRIADELDRLTRELAEANEQNQIMDDFADELLESMGKPGVVINRLTRELAVTHAAGSLPSPVQIHALDAQLAALPPYAPPSRSMAEGEIAAIDLKAALARLALYNELAQAGDVRLMRHGDICNNLLTGPLYHGGCICGRDALLKEMEVPK